MNIIELFYITPKEAEIGRYNSDRIAEGSTPP